MEDALKSLNPHNTMLEQSQLSGNVVGEPVLSVITYLLFLIMLYVVLIEG